MLAPGLRESGDEDRFRDRFRVTWGIAEKLWASLIPTGDLWYWWGRFKKKRIIRETAVHSRTLSFAVVVARSSVDPR
jgi:hypothetical protein